MPARRTERGRDAMRRAGKRRVMDEEEAGAAHRVRTVRRAGKKGVMDEESAGAAHREREGTQCAAPARGDEARGE